MYDEQSLSSYMKISKKLNSENFDKQIKIAILSSFTLNGLPESIRVKLSTSNIFSHVFLGGYNQYNEEIINKNSELYSFSPDICFLFLDARKQLGELYFDPYSIDVQSRKKFINNKFEELITLIEHFLQNSNSKLILNNLFIPTYSSYGILEKKIDYGLQEMIMDFNKKVSDYFRNNSSVYVYDFNSFVSRIGENQIFDYRQYFFGDVQISLRYIPHLSNDLLGYIKSILGINKKLSYLIIDSIFYLKKEKINKVISTGGYMSLPICIAAKFIGLKIYLLEPNFTLGRANKFFLNFSKRIICYSNNLKNFPEKFKNKLAVIKPLVSKQVYQIKKNNDLNKKKFNLLIFGGSQGANIFNTIINKVLIDINKKQPLKVVQQTGIENIENLRNFYNQNKIENKIFNFEKNFIELINESDLCISRAGATSLAEISLMNKPFITIPLPTAKDDHQMDNAKFYEKAGCCWILNQKNFNYEILTNLLLKIVKDKSEYINKKDNLKKLNYQNSWNDVNQKLNKIIDEN